MSSISPERMAPRVADGAHTYLPPTYHHHATADSSHAPLVSLMPQPATPKAAPTAPAAAADSSSGLMAPLALSSVQGPMPVGCFSTSHRATTNTGLPPPPPPSYAATIQHGNANVVGAAPLHTQQQQQQQQQQYSRAAFGASCSASALPISLASSSTEMPSMSLAAGVRAPTAMPSSVSAGGSSSAAAAATAAGGAQPHTAAFYSASGLGGASQPTLLPMSATATVAKPTASHTPPPYQVLDFARTPGMIFVESAAVLESTQRECGRLAVNAPRPTMVAEQSCKDHTLLLSHNHQRLFVSQLPFGLSLLSVQAVMVAILKVLGSGDAATLTATPAAGAHGPASESLNAIRPRSYSSASGSGSAIGAESMAVRPRAGLDESHFYRWEPSSKPNVGYTGCAFLRASHDAATALLGLSKRFMFDCGGVWVATTPAAAAAMADFCEMMKQRPARSRSRDFPWPTPFAAVSIEAQRTHGNAVVQATTTVAAPSASPLFLASSPPPPQQQVASSSTTASVPVYGSAVKQPQPATSTPPALSPPSAGASRIGAFPAVAPAVPLGHVQLQQHPYSGVPSFASSIPAPGLSPVLSAPAAAVMFAAPQQHQQQQQQQYVATPPQPTSQPQLYHSGGQLLVDQQQQQQMLLIQNLQAQIAALQQQQQQQQHQQQRVNALAGTHAPAHGVNHAPAVGGGFISFAPPQLNTSPGASLTKPPSPPPPVAAATSSFQSLLQLATFTPSGVEAGNAANHTQRSQDSPSALPLTFPTPLPSVQPVQFQLTQLPGVAQPPVVLAMANQHNGGVAGSGPTAAAGLTLLPSGMLVYQLPVLPQQQPSPN